MTGHFTSRRNQDTEPCFYWSLVWIQTRLVFFVRTFRCMVLLTEQSAHVQPFS